MSCVPWQYHSDFEILPSFLKHSLENLNKMSNTDTIMLDPKNAARATPYYFGIDPVSIFIFAFSENAETWFYRGIKASIILCRSFYLLRFARDAIASNSFACCYEALP